jgi:hypothetical protein
MRVKLKISILPEDDVGVGDVPPNHLIVTAEPLTFRVDGMYPVAP